MADLGAAYSDLLWTAQLDVRDTAALRRVVDRAFEDLGRVDVIFSNAGRGAFGAAEEMSDEAIDEQIAVTMTAPIHLLRGALTDRIDELDAGKSLAASTDFPA